MPPQQYGIKLATYLISQNFGDLVSKVCECLLQKGTLTLNQIIQHTALTKENVKKCLLVLIQHNCVQSFSRELQGGHGQASNVSVEYMVLFDNILHRMRFPKFFEIVSNELGNECALILQGLLEHGRLSLKQVTERAKEKNQALDTVRESFIRLVTAHYVERCPSSDPFLAMPTEEETAQRKRSSKFAKTMEESETIEQRAIAAAAPVQAKRFLVITEETDITAENGGGSTANIQVGEKRKAEAAGMDKELGVPKFEEEVIWRPNFEEFVHCLRRKACIANVRSRLDDGAAIVLGAMLEAKRSTETKVKTENSAFLSLNNIYEEVMKSEAGRTMTLDHVRSSLAQLGCKRLADDSYSIDLKSIIELAQREEVESLVLHRYERDAYRIFRLLSNSPRCFETDKIADTTFVAKKDATQILYKLWKDNYVDMEKFSTPPPKQVHFMLWKVNKRMLWPHVLDEMYHAALNLKLRLSHELEREQELLELPNSKVIGALYDRRIRVENVKLLLDSSLLKLDDVLMLFHDF